MNTQFIRFVFAGGIAAVVNIVTRILLSSILSFQVSVVLAYLVGMVTAFVLTRYFVFPASGRFVGGEMTRFTIVNLVALAQVWVVSVGLAKLVFPLVGFTWHAELVAHTIGVLSPVITSYLGHKHFTFNAASKNT